MRPFYCIRRPYSGQVFVLVMSFISLIVSGHVLATKLPKFYQENFNPAREGSRLDYVVLVVNGERKVIESGKQMVLVKGEKFKILNARLQDKHLVPSEINLVGLKHPKVRGGRNDIGVEVYDGISVLNPAWAEVLADREIYSVVVASEKVLHGTVTLALVEPSLSYIAIEVNGKDRVFRAGEAITLQRSDEIMIKKVTTNLTVDKGIEFTLTELSKPNRQENKHGEYRLSVTYQNKKFAEVPISIAW